MLKLSRHSQGLNIDPLSYQKTFEYNPNLKKIKELLKQKEMKIFTIPLTQYVKYTKKKLAYQQLYHHSRIRYYLRFSSQVLSKIFRKRFQYFLLNTSVNILIWYFLDNTGLLNILFRKNKLIKKT